MEAAAAQVAFDIAVWVDFARQHRVILTSGVAASTPITSHKFVGFGENVMKAEAKQLAHEKLCLFLTYLDHNGTAHTAPVA